MIDDDRVGHRRRPRRRGARSRAAELEHREVEIVGRRAIRPPPRTRAGRRAGTRRCAPGDGGRSGDRHGRGPAPIGPQAPARRRRPRRASPRARTRPSCGVARRAARTGCTTSGRGGDRRPVDRGREAGEPTGLERGARREQEAEQLAVRARRRRGRGGRRALAGLRPRDDHVDVRPCTGRLDGRLPDRRRSTPRRPRSARSTPTGAAVRRGASAAAAVTRRSQPAARAVRRRRACVASAIRSNASRPPASRPWSPVRARGGEPAPRPPGDRAAAPDVAVARARSRALTGAPRRRATKSRSGERRAARTSRRAAAT